MKFYKKGMRRCIYEYTSARFTQIEKNITICSDIKNAMLNNISNHWSMLIHGMYPVNEYMARIADICPTGEIVLEDPKGINKKYHFKEIRFVV